MNVLAGILGAFLIVSGVGMVVYQFRMSMARWYPDPDSGGRAMKLKAGPIEFRLKTTYPGLVLVGLGVVLILAALIPN